MGPDHKVTSRVERACMGVGACTVAYVRVSPEAQHAKLTAYAALYELDLVAIEVDAGVSAKTLQRPALQQALQRLKAGAAEALLVVKLDRLTRSVKNLGVLVETLEMLMTEPLEKPTQLRLPREALERVETLIPLLAKHPEFRALGRLSKATVLRLAVLHGLEVLEQRVQSGAS